MESSIQYDLFCHEPLNTSENSFRLLDIHGVSPYGLIQCTVRQYNRDDLDQPYYALSYEWGPKAPAGWILLNGKPFPVRKNLLLFLEYTASHPKTRKNMWIDAICIDQDDIYEKNHQVRQMADIYRNAATVFAWLGLERRGEQEAFALLKNVEANEGDAIARYQSEPSSVLMALFNRSYWTRAWIVQELALPQDVVLLCGKNSCLWDTVREECLSHTLCDDRPIELGDRMARAQTVFHIATLLQTGQRPLTLLNLLGKLGSGGICADPHDKVYAVLGMASNGEALEPDYTIPLEELFLQVVKAEYSWPGTDSVTIDAVVPLYRALQMDCEEAVEKLDMRERHAHPEELIRIRCEAGREIRHLYQFWNPFGHDVIMQFDYDHTLASSTELIHPDDIAFRFTSTSTIGEIFKAVIMRQTSNGLFTCVAMAEYCWWTRRCFFYGFPKLYNAKPFKFHVKNNFIDLPAKVVLYLTKVAESSYPVRDVRELPSNWEFPIATDELKHIDGHFWVRRRKYFRVRAPKDKTSPEPAKVTPLLEYPTRELHDGSKSIAVSTKAAMTILGTVKSLRRRPEIFRRWAKRGRHTYVESSVSSRCKAASLASSSLQSSSSSQHSFSFPIRIRQVEKNPMASP